ncbi:MAG: HD domain-containing protein [Spirochaetales bacterium]|nr:HD domain-containing protein [Spirochaetales bacterium]
MSDTQSWEEKYRKCNEEYEKAVLYLKKAVMVQKQNFTGMVALLSDMLSMVNKELGSHVKSVAEYAKSLSFLLKLEKDQRELVYYASLLHDIGLLSAPKDVYAYNPLSDSPPPEGYLGHPGAGENLIKSIPTLARVAAVVRSHHEHWDGTGFPDKLEGGAIPLEARIIAVANTFDWLTRFGHMSPRESLAAIKEHSETMFDPVVAEAFYGLMDQRLKEQETGIKKVSVSELRVGYILNDDLLLSNGMLLFPSGTYLNHEAIERIKKFHDQLAVASHIRVHQ